MSYLRTGLFLAVLGALFLTIGYLLGGYVGLSIALIFAIGMNFYAYWNADRLILRLHGAREADQAAESELLDLVAKLAERAGLPTPRLYIVENDQPNAFATGRDPDNAAVALTTGLLGYLSREEITGVIAHELAHIRNRDTLIMTVTAAIAGAIGLIANFALFFGGNRNNPLGLIGALLVMILAPFAAMLVQMAISRTREYEADRIGANICGEPLWLAAALARIDRAAQRIDNSLAEKNPATAHMFIINPLHSRAWDGLFSTHPNTANRIARLRELAVDRVDTGGQWSAAQQNMPPARGPWS